MERNAVVMRGVGVETEVLGPLRVSPTRVEFDRFYEANREQLYRGVALVVKDPSRARDAVDEGMARAWERWDSVGGYESPEAWVYRVAVNWAVSSFRKRRPEASDLVSVEPVHLDRVPDVELSAAIDQLPVKHRAVIVARFFLDWSVEQTAEALGVSPGTVKSRTSRALARLSAELR